MFAFVLSGCIRTGVRKLPNSILKKKIIIIDPEVIILFGNQVNLIVLNEKIYYGVMLNSKCLLTMGYKTILLIMNLCYNCNVFISIICNQ